ncbi:MAG: response regulator [Nitrospiraceae bacterium]
MPSMPWNSAGPIRTHPDPIHLLITDIRMPDMSGIALADQARAIRPELRVLYISGYGADELALEESRIDEKHFLPKPFGAPILLEKIRTLLVGG